MKENGKNLNGHNSNGHNGNGHKNGKRGKASPDKDLTLKESLWLEAYLQTGNATEAAIRAYDCTEESARTIGAANLAKVRIRERIRARVAEAGVETNEVIGTLASQMRCDGTEFLSDSGGFSVGDIRNRGLGHLIRKMKLRRVMEPGQDEEKIPVDIIELEFHSSQQAAIQLCKVLGIEKQPAENPETLRREIERLAQEYGVDAERVAADLKRLRPGLKLVKTA